MGDTRVASPILYKDQRGTALRHRTGAKRQSEGRAQEDGHKSAAGSEEGRARTHMG
jgi:hypothetical protein